MFASPRSKVLYCAKVVYFRAGSADLEAEGVAAAAIHLRVGVEEGEHVLDDLQRKAAGALDGRLHGRRHVGRRLVDRLPRLGRQELEHAGVGGARRRRHRVDLQVEDIAAALVRVRVDVVEVGHALDGLHR